MAINIYWNVFGYIALTRKQLRLDRMDNTL